jgi:hypothetical protein
MMSFPCPHCGKTLQAGEQRGGEVLVCRHCQNVFVVPAPASNTGMTLTIVLVAVGIPLALLSCLMVVVVCLAAISVLGQNASTTFQTVGTTIPAPAPTKQ